MLRLIVSLKAGARVAMPCGAVLCGVLVLLGGCASTSGARVSQPPAPSIDLSPFRRIWIAGFVTHTRSDIDVNGETVRLLRRRLNPRTPLRVLDVHPLTMHDESEFSDRDRWRKLGEEYGQPLVVTGSVRLIPARPVAVERSAGRGLSYASRKGFVLEATFVFIDGRTGDILETHPLPKETLYGTDQRASTLSLYFQLMDRVVPTFLRALERR